MGSEVLLFGYGLVCFSMILFHLVHSILLRRNDAKLSQLSLNVERFIESQFVYLDANQLPPESHFAQLEKHLQHLRHLLAFDRMLENAELTIRNTTFSTYLTLLQPLLVRLANVYLRRESVQTAYFAHFLTKHRMIVHSENGELQQIMMQCMQKESLYCRVNGLRGLCAFGKEESVLCAIEQVDASDVFFHGKLLTELLLSFTGNHEMLIDEIWKRRGQYQIGTQVALLNYIRFKTGQHCQRFYEILVDETEQKEVRLAAVRYLGRYPYAPAKRILLKMLKEEDNVHWEFASIAASCLARYDGEDVMNALIKAMSSKQWYVRFNAANSLKTKKLDYEDLIEVVHKGDRYAREMVMYRLVTREQESCSGGLYQ